MSNRPNIMTKIFSALDRVGFIPPETFISRSF